MNWGDDRDEGRTGSFHEDRGDHARGDAGQLNLGDDDVRLPWLEGEDEEYVPPRRTGAGQTALLVGLAVVALGGVVGGLYWASQRTGDAPLVADGGVIKAPAEPYKVRPENPGGDIVAGTGDTSFAVAEGQTRPPSIDENAPVTALDRAQQDMTTTPKAVEAVASPTPVAVAPTEKSEPAVSGVGVQVGAYMSKAMAESGWATLKTQYPALGGMNHRVVEGQADIGRVYRLQAVPGDLGAAKSLCEGMRQAGLACQVKK